MTGAGVGYQKRRDDREETALLGTKMEAAALLLTPPTPARRGPPSLRPKPNPKTEKLLKKCGADEKLN